TNWYEWSRDWDILVLLFLVFRLIYLLNIIGNIVIILLIKLSPSLHTPMYFFLVNLSFLEMCYTTSVVPQMLVHLLVEHKSISIVGCAAQMYVFTTLGLTECCLLATMAYDRYVAICHPLQYTLIMSSRVCVCLAAASWVTGFLVEAAQTTWISTLPFCGPQQIHHFFCDILPVVKLACADTSMNEMALFGVSMLFIMGLFLLILVSYVRIISTILKMPSAESRHKAFSTCSAHLMVVTLFFGTALFTYLQPRSSYSPDTDKMISLMYTVVTPLLNPVIYTLRNKEVKGALKKTLARNFFSLQKRFFLLSLKSLLWLFSAPSPVNVIFKETCLI
uniref:Olfactory receptor n=1 Tax=Terrapene triunguis TaxID=2587831 RepID=A0A674IF12_9SAUR